MRRRSQRPKVKTETERCRPADRSNGARAVSYVDFRLGCVVPAGIGTRCRRGRENPLQAGAGERGRRCWGKRQGDVQRQGAPRYYTWIPAQRSRLCRLVRGSRTSPYTNLYCRGTVRETQSAGASLEQAWREQIRLGACLQNQRALRLTVASSCVDGDLRIRPGRHEGIVRAISSSVIITIEPKSCRRIVRHEELA